MIQTARRLTGILSSCPTCGRQPIHVHVHGAEVHFLECAPCELRAPRRKALADAIHAWEALPRETAAVAA